MEANKLLILRDFIGQQKTLFRIPVYQRNYDWAENNCKKLLSDIQNIIKTGRQYFLGAMVYMSDSETFALREYMIIDGQQRLTTMMILLKALADIAHNNDTASEEEINNSYLNNLYCEEKFKVKLKPIQSDNDQFLLLLNNSFDKINKDSHIYKNYDICKKTMSEWTNNRISVKEILEALNKLEIVEISLKKR